MITRYKIGVQYVGTKYAGIAIHEHSPSPTVLSVMTKALEKFCGHKLSFDNLRPSSR